MTCSLRANSRAALTHHTGEDLGQSLHSSQGLGLPSSETVLELVERLADRVGVRDLSVVHERDVPDSPPLEDDRRFTFSQSGLEAACEADRLVKNVTFFEKPEMLECVTRKCWPWLRPSARRSRCSAQHNRRKLNCPCFLCLFFSFENTDCASPQKLGQTQFFHNALWEKSLPSKLATM